MDRLAGPALPLVLGALALAVPAAAQDLHDRPATPSPAAPDPSAPAPPADADQVQFSSAGLDYDSKADIVTATGDVRMTRDGKRLRADKVVWNRASGRVVASGSVAVVNPNGDTAYGDTIELTDTLKDGVVDNMLVVLAQGGRIAARQGIRHEDGSAELRDAAYTPCTVTGSDGCPKDPSWHVTAVRVTYSPDRKRIYYRGARFHLFGLPAVPLPSLSNPSGGDGSGGLLNPSLRYSRANGLEIGVPYHLQTAPDRDLTITPHLFTGSLPMMEVRYEALTAKGAYRVTGYGTVSRRSDDLIIGVTDTEQSFRGYLDAIARFQLSPTWALSGSIRVDTDKTFLRRYELSYDDRLRSTVRAERIDDDSYLSIAAWAAQTQRVNDPQNIQPFALPEIDYRRRFDDGLLGGRFELEANTLALSRIDGQDTQRAFASLRWDLRRVTTLGQEVTLTAFARGDAYDAENTAATSVAVYRGLEKFQGRAIGSVAVDVDWPFVGELAGGVQRITPRVQIVASPRIKNLSIPNEDSRAVDLDDTNLFALNRFPGYDRYEDSSRITYGVSWGLDFPQLAIQTQVGQSYRFSERSEIFFQGTGLSDHFSDIVGRAEVHWRNLVTLTHRFRLDHQTLEYRRNETDATIGSDSTYLLLGYLRLNRDITPLFEDLQDREEARVAGRVQFARFWSAFGSILVNLTDRNEDPLSLSNGFSPIRHRVGVTYEDDCLKLGFSWKRDYQTTGDARRGNGFLLTFSLKNLGR